MSEIKGNQKVETFDGSIALKKDCRFIGGSFYIKNKQCFKMPDGKWHRINNGLIAFDHYKKAWVFKSDENLSKGVVGFETDGKPIIGYYSSNEIENVLVNTAHGAYTAMSEDMLSTKDFVEEIGSGVFWHRDLIGKNISARDIKTKRIRRGYNNIRLFYTFEHQFPRFKEAYDKYFNIEGINIRDFYKELGNVTFGIENETYNGQIPERKCLKSGFIPLKDGSLRHDGYEPYEYATIPLKGAKGLLTIKEHCDLLNKYCVKSQNGSVHIHIGSIPVSPEYAVSVYRLLFQLQKEMYSLFPRLYAQTSLFKNTGKNYCSPLDNIDFNGNVTDNLNKLFYYYINNDIHRGTDRDPTDEDFQFADNHGVSIERAIRERLRRDRRTAINDNYTNIVDVNIEKLKITKKSVLGFERGLGVNFELGMPHPNDTSRNFDHKWNINQRYKHTNLISLLFGHRGTVEFRLHTASFNHDKIINWLFITAAICKYAYKHRNDIAVKGSTVSLNNVVEDIYTSKELIDYLQSYIGYRKSFMEECWSAHKDGTGVLDLKKDDLSNWNHPIKSLI